MGILKNLKNVFFEEVEVEEEDYIPEQSFGAMKTAMFWSL